LNIFMIWISARPGRISLSAARGPQLLPKFARAERLRFLFRFPQRPMIISEKTPKF
jgi:hypothetical protein